MKILKGVVQSKRDGDKKGWLSVKPDRADSESTIDTIENDVQVKYVSPYGGNTYAGSVFMPEAEQQILYCSPDNTDDGTLYYLGSIISAETDVLDPRVSGRTGNPDPDMPHDKDAYSIDDQSMSMGTQTPLGQKILFQEYRGKKMGERVESKRIKIGSERDHGLFLDDSTETSKVHLMSGNQGANVELSDQQSDYDKSRGPNEARITSIHSQEIKSWQGGVKIQVVDGQNFQILNNSTGGHAPACDVTNSALGVAQKYESCGNFQIHTDRGEIVISSEGNGVFIDCIGGSPGSTGASFQVRSQNKIHLYSANGIDIKSAGDVNIKGKNVNIEADNQIQLNPESKIDPAKIGIRSTNSNILHEISPSEAVPPSPHHFFIETPGQESFAENYCESSDGLNKDSRL